MQAADQQIVFEDQEERRAYAVMMEALRPLVGCEEDKARGVYDDLPDGTSPVPLEWSETP